MSDQPELAIATIDPRSGGGVKSVMEFAYNSTMEAGFNPYLVYNTLPWSDCITLQDVLRRNWTISVTEEVIDGMVGKQIGRVLPELLISNYILNRSQWKDILSAADLALVAGGACLPGIQAAHADVDYIVWMGTTLEDERAVQLSQFNLPRRLRYQISRPLLQKQERFVLENAEKVLVQSNHTKEEVIANSALSAEFIDVVPYPVDTELFSPGDETNPHEIVFVGRLNDPRKNAELLLKAFADVIHIISNAKLTIIGDEPNQEYKDLIQNLGIQDNVEIPGKVESVVPYLQRAAVFAFPSRQEGFGIAALEALSCGTPVVSTRCGGPEDFVIDGQSGYLVEEGDTHAFAESLVDILENENTQLKLAEGARSLVERDYDLETVESRLISALSELTDG